MKELKDKIELRLMPVDFHNTKFTDCGNCAIAKAFKRQMEYKYSVGEGVDDIHIYGKDGDTIAHFKHEAYSGAEGEHFETDMKVAVQSNFRGKEPIRTIVLNRVK